MMAVKRDVKCCNEKEHSNLREGLVPWVMLSRDRISFFAIVNVKPRMQLHLRCGEKSSLRSDPV